MSHTPGPWTFRARVNEDENYKGWGVWRSTQFVAEVSPVCDIHGEASAQGRANVHLIAAAPDMLAALQAVIGHGYLESKSPNGQDYVNKTAIAKVRAAIAKAEGK